MLPFQCNDYLLSLRLENANEKNIVEEDIETCDNFLKDPQLTAIVIEIPKNFREHQDHLFQFDAPNSKCISKTPLLKDTLERKKVYVATTSLPENSINKEDPGEGLFLKEKVTRKGSIL